MMDQTVIILFGCSICNKSCATYSAFILSQAFMWFPSDAAIYLTFWSMHHLLTTQVFLRSLDYVTRNTAVLSSVTT